MQSRRKEEKQNTGPKIRNNTENIRALRYVDIPDRDRAIQEEKLDEKKQQNAKTKNNQCKQVTIIYFVWIYFFLERRVCRKQIRAKHVIIKRNCKRNRYLKK